MTEIQKLLDELDQHVKAAKAEEVQNEMKESSLGHHMLALHYAARASAWETMSRLLKTMRAFYCKTKSPAPIPEERDFRTYE